MLLVIAVVHAHLFRVTTGAGGLTLDGTLDIAATAAVALFAENRGYPMFAALFGYGLAQIFRRRTEEGRDWPWTRRLVRRRGRWLIVIGVAHTALLFYGDIIAVYGLIAVCFAAALRFTDRRLLTHAFVWMAVGSLAYSAVENLVFGAAQESAGGQNPGPLLDAVFRLMTLPVMWPMMIAISVFPFLIGVWAERRRLLEEPERHRAFLVRVAAGGIGLAVLGGIPQALVNTEVWSVGPVAGAALFWVHVLTGYAGGFGYAAAIALVALRLGRRRGAVVSALAATGQRSMTAYLLQSVVWAALIPPYALNIAPHLSDAQAVGLGAAVWLGTVVVCDILRRTGFRQGPAEWFLRRMTYGRPARTPRT
ncbi:DUF418 domain-containing protein [Streptomonospora sp. S1-112]|uniref:DUF418 domain-containing protein n=2 Tax=Streptomonospora mangrovi TaxID=2883123 RepID=A0A9X3SGK4_9ACTN|nr:DUF418 domain-containing protein [Streptomonospora mangrovi]MDA0566025.1 DUF418 domain-containing protein [Streptomonospora mangrovi]